MIRNILAGTAAVLAAGGAHAGNIDRSGQSIGALFEAGNYFEVSLGSVSPKISGVATATSPTPGASSGNMSPSYVQVGAAYKHQFSDSVAGALIFDQPFGADTAYPTTQPYFARGTTAELNANALTAILKYKLPSNVSLYGGLRYQTLDANATIPFVTSGPGPGVVAPGAAYMVTANRDGGVGYMFGVAYEKPEIALRVSLTYNSKIKHSLATTESSAFGAGVQTVTEVETPQSVNLDFQSGVAADTLVFGGVRWVDWSSFALNPAVYRGITGGPLVSYRDDIYTFTLGVGRKVTENLSLAASLGYEKQLGGFATNLGPTDGRMSYTLAASYTMDKVKVTGGVTYIDLANAQTTLGGGVAASNFNDNSALAVGLKVGYSF